MGSTTNPFPLPGPCHQCFKSRAAAADSGQGVKSFRFAVSGFSYLRSETWRFMGGYKWGYGVPLRVPLKGSIGI